MKEKVHVFAVVRVEGTAAQGDPQINVTVKEVLPTFEEAEAEVERLNRLNGPKGCRYICQTTRYYPNGREASHLTAEDK